MFYLVESFLTPSRPVSRDFATCRTVHNRTGVWYVPRVSMHFVTYCGKLVNSTTTEISIRVQPPMPCTDPVCIRFGNPRRLLPRLTAGHTPPGTFRTVSHLPHLSKARISCFLLASFDLGMVMATLPASAALLVAQLFPHVQMPLLFRPSLLGHMPRHGQARAAFINLCVVTGYNTDVISSCSWGVRAGPSQQVLLLPLLGSTWSIYHK